uniref:uncharacterized protein LOC114605856 isoform X1 n=1 Tax=Podarcis muralis TaxID=64176 RepID=UPI0010A05ABF|nr:uncharacterized protein LOC114605856 isoform X1 [Podarcis muralis]
MIVKEVYHHLHRISDSSTKEETLSAVVSLATKCLSPVVDSLLECSAECNERAAAMWKALAADPYSSSKLMKPILQRLQDKDPNYMRCSMSQTPNSGPYSHHPQKSTRTLPDNMCHPNTKKRAIGMFQDLVHIIHRRVQEHCQTGTGIYASSQLEEKSHRDGILLGGEGRKWGTPAGAPALKQLCPGRQGKQRVQEGLVGAREACNTPMWGANSTIYHPSLNPFAFIIVS